MWSEAKIQSQKEYFAAQRKQPTGNFTEYVVRTYYCIYKGCSKHQSNSCPAKEVSNYRIKNVIYEGFYHNQPDHDYQNVIGNCKKHLIEMKYIHLMQHGNDDYIFIDKPLDFLLPGEHEAYLKKFCIEDRILPEFQVSYDIQYNAITNHDEGMALLNHMFDPEHYNDPFEKMHPSAATPSENFSCELCDGHYVVRYGTHGAFFGCSNFPRCRSTKTIEAETYSWFMKQGIRIYEVEQPCWKCGKPIKLRSYFPHLDLMLDQPELAQRLDLSIIRLSIIETLDKYLSSKYPEIYSRFSKKFNGVYIANNCPYCHSLQGSTMSLESARGYLTELIKKHQSISKHIAEKIAITETSLPKNEWKSVITEVLKRH
ncbi:MAG: topoisomerase DNA-binding C4 zinc finger domain-containing protein [Peptococcaceae bacterium]